MEKLFDLWFVSYNEEKSFMFDSGIPESELTERIQQIHEFYSSDGYDVVASPSTSSQLVEV